MAVICLHISAVLYVLAGVSLPLLFVALHGTGAGLVAGLFMLAFCLALVAAIEVVAWGLGRRQFWAWIAGLCIFAIYLPSLFLPLGAFGLWGLLDAGSRREFGIGNGSAGSGAAPVPPAPV